MVCLTAHGLYWSVGMKLYQMVCIGRDAPIVSREPSWGVWAVLGGVGVGLGEEARASIGSFT